MNIFSKPFNEVTFDDVVQFCQQKHPEGTMLDYKKEMPRDLAKHFATFSNTLGGVIIIGVEEDPTTGLPLKWEGVPNDGKLLERANQFAANVTPLPSYSVRTTDEVKGNVFVLISILEGDVPPYYANGDPTAWLRTGNISKPLRQADREELVRMVEKKNRAEQLRRENLLTAERTFDVALARAEAKRKQLVQEAVAKGEQPHIRTKPYTEDTALLTVYLQPFYPGRMLTEPWDIKHNIQEGKLQTRNQYGGEMPPYDMEAVPGGLFSLKVGWNDSIRAYQLYGNGLIHYIENIWARNNESDKAIYIIYIANAFCRHLVFAQKFYTQFGYNGVLDGRIMLRNALGADAYEIVPERYLPIHNSTQVDKINDFDWPLDELDTHTLQDDASRIVLFKKVMRKVYWSLGIEDVQDRILDEYLRQYNWQ